MTLIKSEDDPSREIFRPCHLTINIKIEGQLQPHGQSNAYLQLLGDSNLWLMQSRASCFCHETRSLHPAGWSQP